LLAIGVTRQMNCNRCTGN